MECDDIAYQQGLVELQISLELESGGVKSVKEKEREKERQREKE